MMKRRTRRSGELDRESSAVPPLNPELNGVCVKGVADCEDECREAVTGCPFWDGTWSIWRADVVGTRFRSPAMGNHHLRRSMVAVRS